VAKLNRSRSLQDQGPNLPGITAFFGLITEVVSSEDGIETERSDAWPQQR
jgi:hypothetical protein